VITFGSRNLVGSFYRKTSKSDGEMMKVFYHLFLYVIMNIERGEIF
jgi:hypothetical protein